MSRILKAVDLFCGAGGTSQGAEQSGAAKVICAVNHWQRAVDTHSANFPHAQHINSRLDQVNPGECGKIRPAVGTLEPDVVEQVAKYDRAITLAYKAMGIS